MKECNNCHKVLPKIQFSAKQGMCKICERDKKWFDRYGITPQQYLEMYNKQDGRCAICGCYPGKINLAVDHDKNTGKVRGLLCSNCNTALGLLGDSIINLRRAAMYLEDCCSSNDEEF